MTNKNVEPQEIEPLPAAKDLCLSIPLFQKFEFNDEISNPFFSLEHFKDSLDLYCPECEKHSVFNLVKEANYRENSRYNHYIFSLAFHCSRNRAHRAMFIFHAHKGLIQKIGQIPSLADISIPDMRKYRPVLGEERFKELTRGIGLATHGVGIGAFVYLRRTFEFLIENARALASTEENWSDEVFSRGRMDEKISLLRNHLPDFLVQNRSLYGILSIGVHTLSEEECLVAFPAVKLAIELTLDDLLEEHERRSKVKSAAKSLDALKTSIQKP